MVLSIPSYQPIQYQDLYGSDLLGSDLLGSVGSKRTLFEGGLSLDLMNILNTVNPIPTNDIIIIIIIIIAFIYTR